jgi:hypothetical protein
MNHATGPFDVKITPQPLADGRPTGPGGMSRMALDKQFHGDLEATGSGEMLAIGSAGANESGVYVAVERVSGTLHGKRGSFALHHTGVMTRGKPALTITVVPDSGTDELVGIAGTLAIKIEEGGKHFYDFAYALP